MPLSRRATLATLATLATTSLARHPAAAQPAGPATPLPPSAPVTLAPLSSANLSSDPRMTDRDIGNNQAKVVVQEWFSLTCSHCAEFQKSTFPQVKKDLIDTGRIRYIWHDYPLDQVALTAAMVARALPPERYEPFISTLLATQDRWAFARGVNSIEELAKLAALAGLPRATFDATIGDAGLKSAILALQDGAEKQLKINSTPSFIINDKLVAGAIGYPAFLQSIDAA